MKNLCCFVDETGIDTEGRFFLVVCILIDQRDQEAIEQKLEELEKTTRKGNYKWTRAAFDRKEQFLEKLAALRELKGCIFYAVYHETREYTTLTALTIAKAALTKTERSREDYQVNVIVDALSRSDAQKVRFQVKLLKIHYRVIKGLKDEQSTLLRLADSVAGFLRDCQEGKAYTVPHLKRLERAALVIGV
jgi:hypothetical protein